MTFDRNSKNESFSLLFFIFLCVTLLYVTCYMLYENVLVAQWIERLVAVQKVAGSIPAKDTFEECGLWSE